MKPYKILIIEDDPVIQGEMETLLRGNGYTAVSVKDFQMSPTLSKQKNLTSYYWILNCPMRAAFLSALKSAAFLMFRLFCDKLQYRYGRAEQHHAWR